MKKIELSQGRDITEKDRTEAVREKLREVVKDRNNLRTELERLRIARANAIHKRARIAHVLEVALRTGQGGSWSAGLLNMVTDALYSNVPRGEDRVTAAVTKETERCAGIAAAHIRHKGIGQPLFNNEIHLRGCTRCRIATEVADAIRATPEASDE